MHTRTTTITTSPGQAPQPCSHAEVATCVSHPNGHKPCWHKQQ